MSIADRPDWDITELPPTPVRRFTVAEYHAMIDGGVFAGDDRVELLEGWIVPKMTRKPPHDVAIDLAGDALRGCLPPGWRVRVQSAVTLADSEPEPDLAVVRGRARDYLDHHPRPGEIALVAEVADATLSEDRGLKARVYARAAIPSYWIVNLVDGQIEVLTDPTGPDPSPRYRSREVVGAGGSMSPVVEGRRLGPIAARDVLP